MNTPSRPLGDPYDSPRVLRAVLDEITDQVTKLLMGAFISPGLKDQAQWMVDSLSRGVSYRGTPLRKLISLDISYNFEENPNALNFTVRPLSDDGRWLLEQMQLVQKNEVPPIAPHVEDVPVAVTRLMRIVEL
jgi:hypothetical protein